MSLPVIGQVRQRGTSMEVSLCNVVDAVELGMVVMVSGGQ